MMNSLFLDTRYVVALVIERDQYHGQAVRLLEEVEREQARMVTTRAVIVEIGNFLSTAPYRTASIRFIEALEQEPATEILPLSERLFAQGFALYKARSDKGWSLTDCISFVVMRDRGITGPLRVLQSFAERQLSQQYRHRG